MVAEPESNAPLPGPFARASPQAPARSPQRACAAPPIATRGSSDTVSPGPGGREKKCLLIVSRERVGEGACDDFAPRKWPENGHRRQSWKRSPTLVIHRMHESAPGLKTGQTDLRRTRTPPEGSDRSRALDRRRFERIRRAPCCPCTPACRSACGPCPADADRARGAGQVRASGLHRSLCALGGFARGTAERLSHNVLA